MSKDVLFVSWCPLNLLRPRALQVGRAAKALRLKDWRPYLVCSQFVNDVDLFDGEIEGWYRPSFAKVVALTDPAFLDPSTPTPSDGAGKIKDLVATMRARLNGGERHEPWMDGATRAVLRWSRWRRHPVVVSFAQPWASHLAVLAAKRQRPDLRWAAHFSDPWVDNPYLRDTAAELEAARAQEGKIIAQADAVVFPTEDTADLVMRKYPSEWRRKVKVIPHLLDLALPAPQPKAPRTDRLCLLHTGSLYHGTRAPNGLFAALRELLQAAPPDPPLTFRFVGWVPDGTVDATRDIGTRNVLSWTTPLYYSPCLKEMAEADVLVVIDADFAASPFLPSKIFDYLPFDKPLLGLTPPDSATARFLQRLGYPTVGPNDASGIKDVLMKLLEHWRAGRLQPTEAHRQARRAYDVPAGGMRYINLVEELRGQG